MTTAIYWSNVQIDVETAKATAQSITGITKANPGVVTYSGTDPANGDYVLITAVGMNEMNERVARVANVNGAANTFELEGVDTTNFGTFSSGSLQPLTFGVSMTTVRNVSASGGEPEFADLTTIHDTVRSRAPVVNTPLSISLTNIFSASDAALLELKEASDTLTKRAIRLRFANGTKMAFNAYVSASLVPTGSAQEVVETPVTLESQGRPQTWST